MSTWSGPSLPTGTLTFLFTDVEGSTRLWEEHPRAMRQVMARHDALLTQVFAQHDGVVVRPRGEGDSLFAVFIRASDAVAAALAGQRALSAVDWGGVGLLRVRMGLHTGEADLREGDYYGSAVNRCARIRAAGHGGQVLLSQATAQLVRACLPTGVGLVDLGGYRLKDLRESEQLAQLTAPGLPSNFPPLKTLDASPPTNVPTPLTSFVGREQELQDIQQALVGTRLLTLTGAGGTGKTRLAIEAGRDSLGRYTEGVWLVELAALSDAELVPQAVAGAFGVREEPGRGLLQTLSTALRDRHLLLLLDNCEHLLHACARLVDELLRACPALTLLATSRGPLGVPGERVFRVPTLALPEPAKGTIDAAAMEGLRQFDAVRLFVERAAAAQPRFALSPANAGQVVEICRRLDGLPLALELAAARVKVLAVEQLAARLADRFRLLTGGARTALPRQQTLRAAIDWSYALLNASAQSLLQRLSVFAGGWTLAAAEAVCTGGSADGAGMALDDIELLDLLSELVDQSLVVVTEHDDQETRYGMLETIREYAAEKASGTASVTLWEQRHAEFFLAMATKAAPHLQSSAAADRLERLQVEHDNLRAALTYSLSAPQGAERAVRLAGALYPFWMVRGHIGEGRVWLERAVERAGDVPTTARANALNRLSAFARRQGDFARAVEAAEQSLALYREVGDQAGMASTLMNLGNVVRTLGDCPRARVLYEDSLASYRLLDHRVGIATALANLGAVARDRGDDAAADSLYEESLALCRTQGPVGLAAVVLANLGLLARDHGDPDRAEARFEAGLQLSRAVGDRENIARLLCCSATLALDDGRLAEAEAKLLEALATCSAVDDKTGISMCLLELGGAAAAAGRYAMATRLLAAEKTLREGLGATLTASERPRYERYQAAARAGIDEAGFAAAWSEGTATPIAATIRRALAEPSVLQAVV